MNFDAWGDNVPSPLGKVSVRNGFAAVLSEIPEGMQVAVTECGNLTCDREPIDADDRFNPGDGSLVSVDSPAAYRHAESIQAQGVERLLTCFKDRPRIVGVFLFPWDETVATGYSTLRTTAMPVGYGGATPYWSLEKDRKDSWPWSGGLKGWHMNTFVPIGKPALETVARFLHSQALSGAGNSLQTKTVLKVRPGTPPPRQVEVYWDPGGVAPSEQCPSPPFDEQVGLLTAASCSIRCKTALSTKASFSGATGRRSGRDVLVR